MKYFTYLLALTATALFFTTNAVAQYNPGHTAVELNSLTEVGLSIKNSTTSPLHSSILRIYSDQNQRFDMGVRSSTNVAGNNQPYLQTWNDATLDFFIGASRKMNLRTDGLTVSEEVKITSPNGAENFAIEVDNFNDLSVNRKDMTSAIILDGDNKFMGVNMAIPATALHVRQTRNPVFNGPGNVVNNLPGLTIQEESGSSYNSTLFIDNSGHLNIAFNSFYQGWWNRFSGVYTSVSDVRLKKNIDPLESVLSAVNKLQPKWYHFNTQGDGATKTLGFIAQEVEEIFPSLVEDKEGTKALTYDYFGVIAIKAIQEQQQIIERQEVLIGTLIKRIEAIEGDQ